MCTNYDYITDITVYIAKKIILLSGTFLYQEIRCFELETKAIRLYNGFITRNIHIRIISIILHLSKAIMCGYSQWYGCIICPGNL